MLDEFDNEWASARTSNRVSRRDLHSAPCLIKESRGEIRRVVWPTWEETSQTTLIVLVLVLIFALLLWLLDSGLSWLVAQVLR